MPQADPALGLLDELVRADEAHAATLAELDELTVRAATLRRSADALDALLRDAPAELARLRGSLDESRAECDERRRSVAAASEELAAAEAGRDPDRVAAARRFLVRAQDALAMAEKRVGAAAAALEGHEARVEAARSETAAVEAGAAELAAELRGRPRLAADAGRPPGGGLPAVSRWATAAGAALFVARGGVAGEREGVIRQANELASVLLGEPVAAGSVAVVRRQLKRSRGV